MIDFLNKVKQNLSIMSETGRKTVFTIATTSKVEVSPYTTPIRYQEDFVVSGCVLFNLDIVLSLCEIIDNRVDIVLVDVEKLMQYSSNYEHLAHNNDFFSLYDTVNNRLQYSTIRMFKPSDLTVNATWAFLSCKLNNLRDKKVAILGVGNIGSKLSLKLAEAGAVVYVNRRDISKAEIIVNGLNLINSKEHNNQIKLSENLQFACDSADVIIGSTSGVPIINDDLISRASNECLIVDLGKNTLTSSGLEYAVNNELEVYRTDVTAAIEGTIYELLRTQSILNTSYGKQQLEFATLVSGGYLGKTDDVIVDNYLAPTAIYGVANGSGSMKESLCEEDLIRINKLKTLYEIK